MEGCLEGQDGDALEKGVGDKVGPGTIRCVLQVERSCALEGGRRGFKEARPGTGGPPGRELLANLGWR